MSTASAETSHGSALSHKDNVGARIGMWLFLLTEILLFGGLFLLYAVYRAKFPEDFHYCAAGLDTAMGTFNTAILLTSSLTMVLAVTSWEKKDRKLTNIFLWATVIMGFMFLVNKYFEWSAKISHGLYPNSEILETHTAGEKIFYSMYYLMTGLHGLHIVIGLIIILVMMRHVSKKKQPGEDLTTREVKHWWDKEFIKLENTGLYWHLVDVVWIFLFPLFYLIT